MKRVEKEFTDFITRYKNREYEEFPDYFDESEIKYSLSKSARSEVEQALNDKNYDNMVLLRDDTPSIITSHNVPNNRMTMTATHVRRIILTEKETVQVGLPTGDNINYHGLGINLFLDVIDTLDDVSNDILGYFSDF